MSRLSQWFRGVGRGASPVGVPAPAAVRPKDFTLETPEGVKALQSFLTAAGYLDPPSDGVWGGTSDRAMLDALKAAGYPAAPEVDAGQPLSDSVKSALARVKQLPLTRGEDPFLQRVVEAMVAKGYFIARHPTYRNIVTVEGHNFDGTRNDDARNKFNDVKFVFHLNDLGQPVLDGKFEATSTPGFRWTDQPMNPGGAFNIAPGWQKAWRLGEYHGRALRQVLPLGGYRDRDRARIRDTRYPVRGLFGVHHHQGYNLPRDDMRNASAGCQVIRETRQHEKFIDLVLEDARYKANHGYSFAATVLCQGDLDPEAL